MRVAPAVLALFLAGCYSPGYKDCEVSCAQTNACPSGLACLNGMCRVGGNTGACGGGDGGMGSDSGPGDIPIDQLAELQASTLCDYMVRCGMIEDATICRASLRFMFPKDIVEAVAAGKVQYHADKAKQCLDSFKSAACTRDFGYFGRDDNLDASCRQAFTGTVGDAGACKMNEECVSQICAQAPGCPGGCCDGTCQGGTAPATKNPGDQCAKQDHCSAGYCDTTAPVPRCTSYKAAGQGCTSTQECDLTAICDFSTSPAVCRAMSATGGACTSANNCFQLADVCRSGVCVTGGLQGYACTPTNPACQILHGCVNGGTCQPPGKVGDSCAAYPICQNAYCRPSDRTCQPRLADGAACDATTGSDQCESGFCDTTMNKCATPPACF